MISTLRGKATNITSRGSRAQSIPGFIEQLQQRKMDFKYGASLWAGFI
jgi:hypothetical protein